MQLSGLGKLARIGESYRARAEVSNYPRSIRYEHLARHFVPFGAALFHQKYVFRENAFVGAINFVKRSELPNNSIGPSFYLC